MVRSSFLLPLMALACGDEGKLYLTPDELHWGEVNFFDGVPDGGLEVTEVEILNEADVAATVSLVAFDFDHLCVEGVAEGSLPAEIATLDPEQTYLLVVSVCGYDLEGGERDTEVTGAIELDHGLKGSIAKLPWSFTPVLDMDGDDGDTGS